MTTIAEVRQSAANELFNAGVEDCVLETDFLLSHALGISRMEVGMKADSIIPQPALDRFIRNLAQRRDRIPFSYIVGEQPFFRSNYWVTPDVLIPRPETELLVELAWDRLRSFKSATVADVGTGSGCIALSLAPHPQVGKVFAVDISESALSVARKNAEKEGITSVTWMVGDLLSLFGAAQLDLIIANLPYIASAVVDTLSPEVQKEPRLALDGGRTGIELIRRLILEAESVLRPGGRLLLEIGYDQGQHVPDFLQSRDRWDSIELHKDLAQLPRVVEARKR